ncbi:MAG: hypothetical protein GX923_07075 [Clostridia bacterium]|jgi:anti-sigma regulatory factor (Ser/Thr protein kinase)|nr:hypothetical protein [Clostridia bacterium]
MIKIDSICTYIKSLFPHSNLKLIMKENVLKEIKLQIRSDRKSIIDTTEKLELFFLRYCPGWDAGIGFYELLVNAVEHGNNYNPSKKVTITIVLLADAAKIYIEDQGDGFNWQEELEKTASCDIFDERGRGIYLAKIFCDNLMYNEKGNKVCLIKKKNLAKDKGVS